MDKILSEIPLRLEDGIPIPTNYNDVWDNMDLGQSFEVRGERERNRARTSFWMYQQRHDRFSKNVKFVSRHLGGKVYRIWLIDKGASQ